jgi:hypothetical protein
VRVWWSKRRPISSLFRHASVTGLMPPRELGSTFFHHVPMRSTNPVTSLMLSELVLPQSGPAQEWR